MVSVCMATYNGERFIKEQIDSILCQLAAEDELIISDDGSTDKTLEIIDSYKDERIKVLHHVCDRSFSGHEKATANFENALEYAHGDYIFLSDQDDIWFEDKVKLCLKNLQISDFVFHNLKNFESGKEDSVLVFDKNLSKLAQNWITNIIDCHYLGCCIAFKKELLRTFLPFPYKLTGHDYWISSLALRYFKVSYIPEPLIYHRRYIGAVSYKKKNSFLFKIKYRLVLFFQILFRKESI